MRSARPKAWSASSAQPLPTGCAPILPLLLSPTLNSNTFLHNAIQHLGYFANLFPTTRCLWQNLLEAQNLSVASHFWPCFFFRTIIFKFLSLRSSKGTKNNKTPFTMWRQTCVKSSWARLFFPLLSYFNSCYSVTSIYSGCSFLTTNSFWILVFNTIIRILSQSSEPFRVIKLSPNSFDWDWKLCCFSSMKLLLFWNT